MLLVVLAVLYLPVGVYLFAHYLSERNRATFVPFVSCSIGDSGRIVATRLVPWDECPEPNSTATMSINGTLIGMTLATTYRTVGEPFIECRYVDKRRLAGDAIYEV